MMILMTLISTIHHHHHQSILSSSLPITQHTSTDHHCDRYTSPATFGTATRPLLSVLNATDHQSRYSVTIIKHWVDRAPHQHRQLYQMQQTTHHCTVYHHQTLGGRDAAQSPAPLYQMQRTTRHCTNRHVS